MTTQRTGGDLTFRPLKQIVSYITPTHVTFASGGIAQVYTNTSRTISGTRRPWALQRLRRIDPIIVLVYRLTYITPTVLYKTSYIFRTRLSSTTERADVKKRRQ